VPGAFGEEPKRQARYHRDMAKSDAPRAGPPSTGARTAGKAGEHPALTMQLPDASLMLLEAIGRAVDAPASRVMVDALEAYMGERPVLSKAQRSVVVALLRLNP
jgi:hypothetical protein